jgi:hypothetical protein
MRHLRGSLCAVLAAWAGFALTLPASACENYRDIPGLYTVVDNATGAGSLARLEVVGRRCVMIVTLLDPQGGATVLAGIGFTLPELLGCVEFSLAKATDPYKVLRNPVAEFLQQTHLEPQPSCQISYHCDTFPGLPYTCGPGAVVSGRLMRLRD